MQQQAAREDRFLPQDAGTVGRGGGDRTRPPNYKVPWNEGVAAARQIQLLILLTETEDAGCVAVVQTRKERKR